MKQNDYYKQVDYNQVKEFHRVLYAFYSKQKPDFSKLTRFNAFYNPEKKSTSFLGKLMGKNLPISLSKATADLGLLLLNCFPDYRDTAYFYYNEKLHSKSKRLSVFQKEYDIEHLWDGEHFALLELIFGSNDAPLIKKAWGKAPKLMYQTGYLRRSFRKPNDKNTADLLRLNFIIELINNYPLHPFPLATCLQHDIALNGSELMLCTALEEDSDFYQLCCDILQGKAENGTVSRPLIKAMLLSKRSEAWEMVGNTLLAAQRQEGLRQTILESLDETSIEAFQYILKLINQENLTRFSSVVRAIDTWAGFGWDAEKQSTVKRFALLAEKYVTQPELLKEAIRNKDNAEVYMALWGQSVHDIEKCLPYLKNLYETGGLEKQILVLYFVSQTQLSEWYNIFAPQALYSDKPELQYWGIRLLSNDLQLENPNAVFERLETLLKTFPKKEIVFEGKIFSWLKFVFEKSQISSAMISLTHFDNAEEVQRILTYFDELPIENRERLAYTLLDEYRPYSQKIAGKPTDKQRDFAFKVISDRSSTIRSMAMKALEYAEINDNEILFFEDMLKRKSSDFRQFVLNIIQKRQPEAVFESSERLLEAPTVEQRLAGLDLLCDLKLKNIQPERIANLVTSYTKRQKIGKIEQSLINTLQQEKVIDYDASNGYGLYDPNNKTVFTKPEAPTSGFFYENIVNAEYPYGFSKPIAEIQKDLSELEALFLVNKDYEYEIEHYNNSKEKILLGNGFFPIKREKRNDKDLSPQEIYENYPLPEVWKKWFLTSQLTTFDLFLIHLSHNGEKYEAETLRKAFPKTTEKTEKFIPKITETFSVLDKSTQYHITNILYALSVIYPFENKTAYFIDGWQYLVSQIDKSEEQEVKIVKGQYYNQHYVVYQLNTIEIFKNQSNYLKLNNNIERFTQFWNVQKYVHQATISLRQNSHIPYEYYIEAYQFKLCSKDELMAAFFHNEAIKTLTSNAKFKYHNQTRERIFKTYPFVEPLIENIRNRILEIELRRGDSSTSVTKYASAIQSLYGLDYLVQILNGLGKDTLNRGYSYSYYNNNEYSKKEMFSVLLKRCYPDEKLTQAVFNTTMDEAKFSEKRLVEVAMYAQQWLPFIQNYLGWEAMDSAVWWLHAHTNAYHSSETETEIAKYTQIDIKQFSDGVVDYHWFKDVYDKLGKQKWQLLYDAAKYISEGNGHSRAKLYADVILENTKIREVSKRIKEKRNQDYVRVYGLVPLSKTVPEKDVLNRFNYLLEFKKESKQFGAQRQASEQLAVDIALENLAFTAGYPDPIRLTWAMETQEAKTIMSNAKALTFDDYSIELQVDEFGKSSLTASRNGNLLKNIPSKYKNEKAVVELKDFHSRLSKQYSRSRKSLEDAMVRGDIFKADEIRTLSEHPVIAPMLKNLVLISESGMGFYQQQKLVAPNEKTADLGEEIRIAHCTDMYASNQWAAYQQYCFKEKIIQPFKQIFRELYIPTKDELDAVSESNRYAGHQVQPKKTMALLKSRGWKVDYEEGLQKVFHKEGYIAKIYAMADWFSPADVESPTLETVTFIDRKTYKNVAFKDISPLIFSEIMRDLDLVVSVAHVGGVDPETSSSTIEMRSAIIKETLQLFKLHNVKIEGTHALINGKRADYSVHIGSGVTHLRPGKSIFILPVHSQHRGRIFLPFVDEDPKSAEIMSKILLLSKDQDLKDPTILNQLQ